jgi:NADH-quinone oxidoreductase subunit N
MSELQLILPEIFVLTMACAILLLDAYLGQRMRTLSYQAAQATLIGAAALGLMATPAETLNAFHNTLVSDRLSLLLKTFIYLITFGVFLYAKQYLQERNLLKGEFFVLGLFAVLGMMVMVSASHFLTLYLGLELLSLSLYAMVAMHRESQQASEAAMKYFILGALASGMLLYGMSMLYGATGSLELKTVAAAVQSGGAQLTVLTFGLVFIVVGLGFKLGAVPFHMWVPDVYQGAPTAVTVFIGSAPKLAAFAMLIRLLVEGLPALHPDWRQMLIVLAVLSMAVGNIVAIAQTNLKRMLGYSTISHVGFLMLGVLTGTHSGNAASLFYTIVYALMSLGAFGMIILLSRAGFEAERLDDFKGLNQRSPWYAFVMLILMLSMAGVPPLLGFWAKWSVLSQVVSAGLMWLAILAVLLAVIGAFYYLRMIKLMYFDPPQDSEPLTANLDMRIGISVNALLILGLGLMPQSLMQVCLVALG